MYCQSTTARMPIANDFRTVDSFQEGRHAPGAVHSYNPAAHEASLWECGGRILHEAVRQGAELDTGVQIGRQRHEGSLAHRFDVAQDLERSARLISTAILRAGLDAAERLAGISHCSKMRSFTKRVRTRPDTMGAHGQQRRSTS